MPGARGLADDEREQDGRAIGRWGEGDRRADRAFGTERFAGQARVAPERTGVGGEALHDLAELHRREGGM